MKFNQYSLNYVINVFFKRSVNKIRLKTKVTSQLITFPNLSLTTLSPLGGCFGTEKNKNTQTDLP